MIINAQTIKVISTTVSILSAGLSLATDMLADKKLDIKIDKIVNTKVAEILKEKGL